MLIYDVFKYEVIFVFNKNKLLFSPMGHGPDDNVLHLLIPWTITVFSEFENFIAVK